MRNFFNKISNNEESPAGNRRISLGFLSGIGNMSNYTTTNNNDNGNNTKNNKNRNSTSSSSITASSISRNNRNIVNNDNNIPGMLYCAAHSLSNSIEEILNDTSNLTGSNIQGFYKLLDILNNEDDKINDYSQLATSNGRGCMIYLMNHLYNPILIDICIKASLPTSLIQGLRLLRMLEIKKTKLVLSSSELIELSTIIPCKKICKLMIHLCTDSSTIENIRNIFIKVVTFPLGMIPIDALHIQSYSADIIYSICKTGFTLQQVWFLHDIQVIHQMIKTLSELTLTTTSTSNTNTIIVSNHNSTNNIDNNNSSFVIRTSSNASNNHIASNDISSNIDYCKEYDMNNNNSNSERNVDDYNQDAVDNMDFSLLNEHSTTSFLSERNQIYGGDDDDDDDDNNYNDDNNHHNDSNDVRTGTINNNHIIHMDNDDDDDGHGKGDNGLDSIKPSRFSLAFSKECESGNNDNNSSYYNYNHQQQQQQQQQHHHIQEIKLHEQCQEAEESGMWLIGVKCIVDVIAATSSLTPILMSDFEISGGNNLFLHILKYSSSKRFILVMNIILQLLFDPLKKSEDTMISTNAGLIFIDLLLDITGLNKSLLFHNTNNNDNDNDNNFYDFEYMIGMSTNIMNNKWRRLVHYEYIIQSMSYSLLTIYSNNPFNCSILEEEYHFLLLLILSLPSLLQLDSIVAVLTIFSYVCISVDSCSIICCRAICAATHTIIQHFLFVINQNDNNSNDDSSDENDDNSKNNRIKNIEYMLKVIESIFQSIESIIKTHEKYALHFIQNGLLRNCIFDPFVQLCDRISRDILVNEYSIILHSKILDLLIILIHKTSQAADDVRDYGFNLLIQSMVASTIIPTDFTKTLLKLTINLAVIDKSHLTESLKTIFTTMILVENNFTKQWHLTDSLYMIILENDDAANWCYTMNGLDNTIGIIISMKDQFKITASSEGKYNLFVNLLIVD